MKIKILQDTVALKKVVREGEILEVPDQEAKFLIGIKKAEIAIEQPAQPEAPVEEAEAPKKKGKKS
jgi:hypothetical protein